jgi:GNAT superfamily N-acetyltransferase
LTVDLDLQVEQRSFSLLVERLVDLLHIGGRGRGSRLLVSDVGQVSRLVVWNGYRLRGLAKRLVGTLEETCFKYGYIGISFIRSDVLGRSRIFLDGADHSKCISNLLFGHGGGRRLSNFLEPVVHLLQALLRPSNISVQIIDEFIALQVLA